MQIVSAGPAAAASLSRRWLIKVRQTGSSLEKAAEGWGVGGRKGGEEPFDPRIVWAFSLGKVK